MGIGFKSQDNILLRLVAVRRKVQQNLTTNLPRKVLRTWSEHGCKGLWAKVVDTLTYRRSIDQMYAIWIKRYDTVTASERQRIRAEITEWLQGPLISVIMAMAGDDLGRIQATIVALCKQPYPYWELCLCVGAAASEEIHMALQLMARGDRRIRVLPCDPRDGVCKRLNRGLAGASGEFIALLDGSDLLSEHALYWVARELKEHPDADLLFSDEDKTDVNGRRFAPYFKPDWNPALMLSCNAFGRLAVFRRGLVGKVDGFDANAKWDHEHDLVLRCAQATRAERIRHVPRVLYHRFDLAVAPGAESNFIAGRRAIEEYLASCGVRASVTRSRQRSYQIDYAMPSSPPRISILIPTTGTARLLEPCIESIRHLTTYENYEVLLAVNERHRTVPATATLLDRLAATAGVRVLCYPDRAFNYAWVNNWAAQQAAGDLLCFLNDDTTVITARWLERLAARVLLPGIGAVGPTLLYPGNTIQHAGVVLGVSGVAGHACHGLPRESLGYFGRAYLEQDVSCLTAACLMMRRSLFQELGGFDEDLPIAFNDVDLCLRLRSVGWRLIWTPTVELYHRESASVGRHDAPERNDEFSRAVALMRKRWGPVLDADPYYSPNLSLRRAFHLAFPPRQAVAR